MTQVSPVLLQPHDDQTWRAARELVSEYANSLRIDLCFQDFDNELISLNERYAAPLGGFFLATVCSQFAGCCAFRQINNVDHVNACEMKRLYVRKPFRGLGLGRLLAEAVVDGARQSGYSNMLLDTLSEMETARSLYEDLGFIEIPPYYPSPLAGAHYLLVKL